MATEWYMGVPWYDRVMVRARELGVIGSVARIARSYREGTGSFTSVPDNRRNAMRVIDGRISVLLSEPAHVIVGFLIEKEVEKPSRRPDVGTKPQPRAPGRKAVVRGPRDHDELVAWLAEDGYTVKLARGKGGHYGVFDPEGHRVGTLGATNSDHRSFINEVTDIRRATGLSLRRKG
jgi:hypothetical protein